MSSSETPYCLCLSLFCLQVSSSALHCEYINHRKAYKTCPLAIVSQIIQSKIGSPFRPLEIALEM